MKKTIFLSFIVVVTCGLLTLAKPPINYWERIYLPDDKEQEVIMIAKNVAATHAPDYDISNAIPKLFIYLNATIPDRKMTSVYFMRDSTDYFYACPCDDETGNAYKFPVPNGILSVNIALDTMEPIGIMGDYGITFRPDYEEFLKVHPNFYITKNNNDKQLDSVRDINEITKEELEKQGIKVYLEDPDKKE